MSQQLGKYIGGGVYVSLDGNTITLQTPPDEGGQIIRLWPGPWGALREWLWEQRPNAYFDADSPL